LDAYALSYCAELRMSPLCAPLIDAVLILLQKDCIPSLRLKPLESAIASFNEAVKLKNPAQQVSFEKACRFFLDYLDRYLDIAHGKLKRNRIGRTFKALIEKIENNSGRYFEEQALLKLIALDPAWIYDARIQNKIEAKIKNDDQVFLKRLGQSLSDSKSKCFWRTPKGKIALNIQQVFKYATRSTGNNPLELPLNKLVDLLLKHPQIDPDDPPSPDYLRKYLKRHTLQPTISLKLDA